MPRDWKMELYWRLPVLLQERALSMYARRLDRLYYGDDYEKWRGWFRESAGWTREQAEAWQSSRLREILDLAANTVPHYRAAWSGIDWKGIASPSTKDLSRLPRLDKQTIRENERQFLAGSLDPDDLWVEKTSGTSGTALRIYWPMSMLPRWWALTEVMVRNAAGVAQEIPRAMMGGRAVVRGDATHPPYWRFNARWRQLYLSSYHVSKTSAPGYVDAMRHYGSRWITGYGSAMAALADSALEAGIPPFPLEAAITSGDTLLPGMRAAIEQFFQCRCFDHYGQCEGVAMAMECREGRMHVIPSVGIVEILREDGSPCEPGEVGEIVATGLMNDAMPLVRYRLADYAAWAADTRCACGNPHRSLERIEGRVDDYLRTASGRKIGRLAGFRGSPAIHSAQLVQDTPSHAWLLVRPGAAYSRKDAERVRGDILSRAGDLSVDIREVSEIPKTRQGKTILVVRLEDRPDMRETYARLLGERAADVKAAS
jgi:phenylacetate-CoA ligase